MDHAFRWEAAYVHPSRSTHGGCGAGRPRLEDRADRHPYPTGLRPGGASYEVPKRLHRNRERSPTRGVRVPTYVAPYPTITSQPVSEFATSINFAEEPACRGEACPQRLAS